jgi:hypothetical protein
VPSLGGRAQQPPTGMGGPFDWVNQPRFDNGASVSDLRMSPFAAPAQAASLDTGQAASAMPATQQIAFQQPLWWLDEPMMGGFGGGFGGGWGGGGGGFGGFGEGLGGGLSFGGLGGW